MKTPPLIITRFPADYWLDPNWRKKLDTASTPPTSSPEPGDGEDGD